jgi:hypothetical protein
MFLCQRCWLLICSNSWRLFTSPADSKLHSTGTTSSLFAQASQLGNTRKLDVTLLMDMQSLVQPLGKKSNLKEAAIHWVEKSRANSHGRKGRKPFSEATSTAW